MADEVDVQIQSMGRTVGCFGWAMAGRWPLPEDLPVRTFIKVLAVNDPRGWGPDITLKVRNRDGREWTISETCFEPRVRYSFDCGRTWLTEKHYQVRAFLVREFNSAEADLDRQTDLVAALRWKMERNNLDPDRRRRDIEALQRTLQAPCRYHKPGHGRRQWEEDRRQAAIELRKLKDGHTPRHYHDHDDDAPY